MDEYSYVSERIYVPADEHFVIERYFIQFKLLIVR
jgi:hypothetical protein